LRSRACGPSDADIKAEADKAVAGVQGVTVDVASGVATISGQVANEAARTTAETAVK
jgi:hyperosmotically inducible protein